MRVELSQDVEAGAARQVQVDEDASRGAQARHTEEGFAFDEGRDLMALAGQYHRQRRAHRRIVVDNEDFAHQRPNLHSPMIKRRKPIR